MAKGWKSPGRVVPALAALAATALTACGTHSDPPGEPRKLTVGFAMATLREDRWRWDRDLVVTRCEELGARVLVRVTQEDEATQARQVRELLRQPIDVLLIAAVDAQGAAHLVEAAHQAGVPVIAYDRLIREADLDLYVSFDSEKVGALQADALLHRQPAGRYVLVGGSPKDHNALLIRSGLLGKLGPAAGRGEVSIVADRWAEGWSPEAARTIVTDALLVGRVDAVAAANDALAGAAIEVLASAGLAGRVPVGGQDADLAACRRIVAGTQLMTVYKPIWLLAKKAGDMAVRLARKQAVGEPTRSVFNGRRRVPSILLDAMAVDRDNLAATVVADGYHRLEDIYADVPRALWPPPPPRTYVSPSPAP